MGVPVKVATGGRDVGVIMPRFKRRRLGILGARLTNAAGTMHIISRLAKDNRRATRLIKGAAIPQDLWGIEWLGLSPSQLLTQCRQLAVASGCAAHGICVITAIAFSNMQHLAVDIVRKMITPWFSLLRTFAEHMSRLMCCLG